MRKYFVIAVVWISIAGGLTHLHPTTLSKSQNVEAYFLQVASTAGDGGHLGTTEGESVVGEVVDSNHVNNSYVVSTKLG